MFNHSCINFFCTFLWTLHCRFSWWQILIVLELDFLFYPSMYNVFAILFYQSCMTVSELHASSNISFYWIMYQYKSRRRLCKRKLTEVSRINWCLLRDRSGSSVPSWIRARPRHPQTVIRALISMYRTLQNTIKCKIQMNR